MPAIAQLVSETGQNAILTTQSSHPDDLRRSNELAPEAPFSVLITGFGPFTGIPVNPSWQAIKALHNRMMSRRDGRLARISCVEVPVVYEAVLDIVPKAHGLDQPQSQSQHDCFVHVGVSPARSYVSLEKRARRFQYDKLDFAGRPCRSAIDDKEGRLVYGLVGPEWDSTGATAELVCPLDVEEIAARLRAARLVDAQISTDAGACDYAAAIYDKSRLTSNHYRSLPLRIYILYLASLGTKDSNRNRATSKTCPVRPCSQVCLPYSLS
jgi:pyroglutamyl-peptidase